MSKAFLIDLAERVAIAYIEQVLAFLALHQLDLLKVETWKLALFAGIGPAISVLKGLIASRIKSRDNASLVK